MAVSLRPATPDDIPLLRGWNSDPVIARFCPTGHWDWQKILATTGLEGLIGELDGRPIGFVLITDLLHDTTGYWGAPQAGLMSLDIWIGKPELRGEGHGRALMALAIDRCFADPAIHALLVDPLKTNSDAIGFFQRIGFTFLEDRSFGDDQCAVHHLTRQTWQRRAVSLRPATHDDIPLLELWDEEPVVAASDPDDEWGWEETLAAVGFDTFVAELDGHPFGVVQITDLEREESRYWGEPQTGILALDVWIGEPDLRGKGHGRAMMEAAIARCFADPAIHTILIDPLITNTEAIAFYQRLGFTFLENRQFGDEVCAVHQLTRQIWQQGQNP